MSLLAVPIALFVDHIGGELRRFHPLIGFGRYASALEKKLNSTNRTSARLSGMLAWIAAVLPFYLLTVWLLPEGPLGFAIEVLLLYLAIGARSLREHALVIYQALLSGNIRQAREATAMIVSRDTGSSDESQLAGATVESVLENGCDAVFGALFWFAVAGAPGVVLYRLSNTLDAMWGYKTPRYRYFGWAAARIDDVLNYVPARLTGLTYALAGNFANATQCIRKQSSSWKSPNAGLVMAAGAGALVLELGGKAIYQDEVQIRPVLGRGSKPVADDILRALRLVTYGVQVWIGVLILVWGVANIA